jgi:hypothetical protein
MLQYRVSIDEVGEISCPIRIKVQVICERVSVLSAVVPAIKRMEFDGLCMCIQRAYRRLRDRHSIHANSYVSSLHEALRRREGESSRMTLYHTSARSRHLLSAEFRSESKIPCWRL